jgi:hypothetical protein
VKATLWIALAVAACRGHARPPFANDVPPLSTHHEVMATLERTSCYGRCPIYKITIFRDGVVEYVGEQFVKTKGAATWHIDQDAIEALDKVFVDGRYFDLHDEYMHEDVSDRPEVLTSYRAGPRTKAITHSHGDTSAPESLRNIEDRVDRIVRIEPWIGTADERQRAANEPLH